MKKILLISGILLLCILFQLNGQEIIIDPSIKYQTIEGFGGFGPKKVWWDSGPYYDKAYLDQVIDSLGCHFIRTQIYWNSEQVNDDTDPNHFNWAGFHFKDANDDNGKQLAFIRDMNKKGAKLIATVWTPPIWMKGLETYYGTYNGTSLQRRPSPTDLNTNCSWCGGANGCTQVGGRLKPEFYEEFAEYLAAYVISVKQAAGTDVYAINIQNEPMFANPFESCVVPPEEYALILKTVALKFQKEGIKTKLFGPEHMGEWTWGMNTNYVKSILQDTTVNKYLDFYSVHSYVDGVAADYGSAAGWTNLHNQISVKYGKELWMTETSDFIKTGFDLGFDMAKGLFLALKFGEISGWVYWYMADAMIQNNKLTKLGYSFKNFYKFIQPGMKQCLSTSSDKSILCLAFSSDTSYCIVLINDANSDKTSSLSLAGGTHISGMKAFRTSATENCLRLSDPAADQLLLPAKSITTLTFSILTSVNSQAVDSKSIYPNPSAGVFHLSSLGSNYFLTDIKGTILRSGKMNSDILDLRGFQNGIYLFMMQTDASWNVQRLVIQN